MMLRRLLVLDASGLRATVALLDGTRVVAMRVADRAAGPAADVPLLAREVLAGQAPPDGLAVVAGPGSFTGLRATLAFAAGFADGRGIPAIAVSVPEVLARDLPGDRPVWCAQAARGDLLYLTREGESAAVALATLPAPPGPVAVAGDAADRVVAALAARGCDAVRAGADELTAAAIAAVARDRAAGALPPRPLAPVYAEPPRARPAPVRAAPY